MADEPRLVMTGSTLTVEARSDDSAGTEGGHAYKVVVSGELDLDNAPALTAQLNRLIASGATRVTLDASGAEFMDSTGLRAIVAAGTKLAACGGRLQIDGISGAVQRVLEITGLLERYQSPR